MGNLTNQYVSQSFQGLLKLDNSNTGVTATLQYVQDGLGNNIPMQVSTSSVVITGSLIGSASYAIQALSASYAPDTTNTGSLVSTSSFNAYTSSNDSKVNSLIAATGSFVTEAESGSFMITGSVAGNTLTFTKGNGSQFNLQVNTGSLPAGVISGSQQITNLGFATTSSLTSLSASIATTDLGQNNRLGSLETATGSLQNQINQKLDTGSFNTYTSSNDGKVNSLINATGSYATTSSVTALSQSIASTDLAQNNRLTSIEGVTGSFASTSSLNSYTLTSSFNTYTSSNDGKVNALINATGSYATTGSNVFQGTQTITGSLGVTGTITALSASITYLETIYQTSSVLFSSGSNILGDEAGDTQTLFGTVRLPNGPLVITGSVTASAGFSGNLTGTASYATNALSASQAQNAVSASYAPDTTNTGSLVVSVVRGPVLFEDDVVVTKGDGTTNTFTINNVVQSDSSSYSNYAVSASQAQNAVSSSFATNAGSASYAPTIIPDWVATTGSNVFVGAQTINNDLTIASTNPFGTFVNMVSTGTTSFNLDSPLTQFQSNGQIIFTNTLASTGSSDISFLTQNGGDIILNTSNSGSVAITGSINISGSQHRIIGNTVITGSVILSGSAGVELDVKGDQTITGSLSISGSQSITQDLKLYSSASYGGVAVPGLYITASSPVSQSNLIFASTAGANGQGPLIAQQTGSIIISGSNNILFASNRVSSSTAIGYIGGSSNIVGTIPTLNPTSLHLPSIANNQLQAAVGFNFTTSSLSPASFTTNLVYGSVTINSQSGSIAFSNNLVLLGPTINAQTTTLGLQTSLSNNALIGTALTLNQNSSSILYNQNIGGLTVTNNYSSSVSTAVNNITMTQNLFNGSTLSLVVTGSNTANRRTFNSNLISGRLNEINSNQSGSSAGHLVATSLLGQNLIVSASNTSTTSGGTVIVGRFNATGSLQESAQDTVFVVGSGASAGARRNSLKIDSSGNTELTGSVNISGSLGFATGSLAQATGSFLLTYDGSGSIKYATPAQITPSLFSVGDFYSTQTQTLAAGVSGSVTYNNTGTTYGVSLVSTSRLTIANAGVYSITFSAQIKGDGGQDTVYIWLKKNGTNVADTGTKIIAKNNEEDVMTVEFIVQAAASDYYEIAWQNTTGDGDLAYYAASGNIPVIPSIITSVKQIR